MTTGDGAMTAAEYRAMHNLPPAGSLSDTMDVEAGQVVQLPEKRTQKYRNEPTVVDGHKFPSKAEARRYVDLKRLQDAGEIRGLQLQIKYPLVVGTTKVGFYQSDFTYYEGPFDLFVIEDVKGMKTPIYRLKKKLMKAIYGIDIRETT